MFTITILTPEGKKHVAENTRVSLPTADGVRTILTNHMDIAVPVEIGTVKLITERGSNLLVISEGIFYFEDNVAKLFVRTFEFPEEIDRARAERARRRAEDQLATELSAREMRETELALKRALTRLSATR